MAGALYGSAVWDPVLILAQIVAIQCCFYSWMGVFLWLLVGPYVPKINLHQFFDWRWIAFHSFTGWMLATANFAAALAAAVALRVVVERAKKCLDFAVTVYCLHLVAVSMFSSFPREFEWWLVNGIGLMLTAVVGEWLCIQKEMQEIPLSSLRRPDRQRSNGVPAAMTELQTVSVRK